MVHVMIKAEERCDHAHSSINVTHEENPALGNEFLGSEEPQSVEIDSDGEFLQEAVDLNACFPGIGIPDVGVAFRKIEFIQLGVDVDMVVCLFAEVDPRLIYLKFGIRRNRRDVLDVVFGQAFMSKLVYGSGDISEAMCINHCLVLKCP